jgi:hypothetical protein
MLLKSLIKFSVGAFVAGSLVSCDQIPQLAEKTDEANKNSGALTGGNGFEGGKAKAGEGVPAEVMTSLLGLWRGDCVKDDQGGPEAQEGSDDLDEQGPGAPPPGAPPGPPALLALMQDGEGAKEEGFRVEEMRFTNTGAVQRSIMYKAEGCASADKAMEMVMHMDYAVGDEVKKVPGAREIDFELAGGEMVLHDADIIAMMNEMSMCGKADWEQGKPIDLKALDLASCADKNEAEGDNSEIADAQTDPDSAIEPAIDPTAAASLNDPAQPPSGAPKPPVPGEGDEQEGSGGQGGEGGMPQLGEKISQIFKIEGDKILMGLNQGPADKRPIKLDSESPMKKVAE